MAKIKIAQTQIMQLDEIASEAYGAMSEQFLDPPEYRDFAKAQELYVKLHKHLIGVLRQTSTYNYLPFNKGGKRSRQIEKYILQAVLMMQGPQKIKGQDYTFQIDEACQFGLKSLTNLIDAKDEKRNGEGVARGVVFRLLERNAALFREDKNYGVIFDAIKYVNEKYDHIN